MTELTAASTPNSGLSVQTTQGQTLSRCKKPDGSPTRFRSVQLSKEYYDAERANKISAGFALGVYNCHEIGAVVNLEIGEFKGGRFDYKGAAKVGKKRVIKVEVVKLSDIGDKFASMAELSIASLKEMIGKTRGSRVRQPDKVNVVYLEDVDGSSGDDSNDANAGNANAADDFVGKTFSEADSRPGICKKGDGSDQPDSYFYKYLAFSKEYYSKDAFEAVHAHFALGLFNCHKIAYQGSVRIGAIENGSLSRSGYSILPKSYRITKIEYIKWDDLNQSHSGLSGLKLEDLKQMLKKTAHRRSESDIVKITHFEEIAD